jgi:hypothetical protein
MAVQGLLMGVAAVLGGQTTPPLGWNSWDCYQGNLNETGGSTNIPSLPGPSLRFLHDGASHSVHDLHPSPSRTH